MSIVLFSASCKNETKTTNLPKSGVFFCIIDWTTGFKQINQWLICSTQLNINV